MFLLDKKQIRESIIRIRNNLTETERNTAENIIRKKFIKHLVTLTKKGDNIAIYYPIDSEINVLSITKDLSLKFLLPVLIPNSKILKFFPWKSPDELVPSIYNKKIMEPRLKIQEVIPDLVIAPLIACDIEGNRVGSGKAIYDSTISYLRKINRNITYITLCYDFQIINKIVAENHDQKLDIILSETVFHVL